MKKELGKISKVRLGDGGYQDAMFGISLSFSINGGSGGVGDFKGTWGLKIGVDKHTEWTEADRDKYYGETMRFMNDLIIKAKVDDVMKLEGIPVELTLDCNTLKSWRILEEVL